MPSIGDVKTMFGRTYVYVNPNQALGPGTWLLSDDDSVSEGTGAASTSTMPVYGQAVVSVQGPITVSYTHLTLPTKA